MIDESLTYNEHIKIVVNKLSKNVGILYKAKSMLNHSCLKQLYFSFINCYANYGNIVWASTFRTKLKRVNSLIKQASRIIFDENKQAHSKLLLKSINALDV